MKAYYVDGFSGNNYRFFLAIMISLSDSFSLVYYKKRNGNYSKKAKKIDNALTENKLYEKETLVWPGTQTLNYSNDSYVIKLYRTDAEVIDTLLLVDSLWDWDYPDLPIDLAFYKNGYAWFWSCSHERLNKLYTDDQSLVSQLYEIGLDVSEIDDSVDKSELYYDNMSIVNKKNWPEVPHNDQVRLLDDLYNRLKYHTFSQLETIVKTKNSEIDPVIILDDLKCLMAYEQMIIGTNYRDVNDYLRRNGSSITKEELLEEGHNGD